MKLNIESNEQSEQEMNPQEMQASSWVGRGEERQRLSNSQLLRALKAIIAGSNPPDLPDDLIGIDAQIVRAIEYLADNQRAFEHELLRLSQAIGQDGRMSARMSRSEGNTAWSRSVNLINAVLDDLNHHTESIVTVVSGVAKGDLSPRVVPRTIGGGLKGDFSNHALAVNEMVEQLGVLGSELTRVTREFGLDGNLGTQAHVPGVSGAWKELTDGVNLMSSNLTAQVREIARVTTAVAQGDLTKTVSIEVRGELLELKHTINTMVSQLSSFAAEVTRVAREVGTQGILGGQAQVRGVSGVWRELTESVNSMANNLTLQVRNIADVSTAIAAGDLSKTITVEVNGELLDLKRTINTMVDQLSSFADEVTRVAREVGTEGILGGTAEVPGASGIWRDLTRNVNGMATNLTNQVRNIAEVTTAIAHGDLSRKITVDARGEMLQLKNTINKMVDSLSFFADEVTRLAREVGTEGVLGGQAHVHDMSGLWRELTANVNSMASNLTNQVRNIAEVASAVADGDLSRKITVDAKGEVLELKIVINDMVEQLNSFSAEVTRVAREVGVEGKLGGQAEVLGASGTWRELTDNVNLMASNLTNQVRDIANVTTAVATGDLSKKITVEVRGELAELKSTVNTMVDQLSSFAAEVTRVAREVGTLGILGGQAEVSGIAGTWRELTDNVNIMARNLTEQVRGIARVVTAVANGEFKQELRLEARGEIATLVETMNDMLVTLSTLAEQVGGVARDVGVEGRLGGQADVPSAAGAWRIMTNNVNELAGNLTRQVRAIGDVATAVTKGDLTQSIDVEARGEVALLKDNINQMIRTLADTTRVNREQDWLKTNLTRFTRMLQGQRDLRTVAEQVLSELAPVVNAQYGTFYLASYQQDEMVLQLHASYAYPRREQLADRYALGEGIVGQAARDKRRLLVERLPIDYVSISSSLGQCAPASLVAVPLIFEDQVKGVIELASVEAFSSIQLALIDQLVESLGIGITTIEAAMRTNELLHHARTMAEELQTQQEVLQKTNEALEEKAAQLTTQRDEVERKNQQVNTAKAELEEKAEQLALTSRYKSEFLANMSHELRTPLNSLLILSQILAKNSHGNLSEAQVEYAQTINQAGNDLLELINEILDLAKIESGTMPVDVSHVELRSLQEYVERSFREVADHKGLSFQVVLKEPLPAEIITDELRLRQVIRNLISNAIKFTEEGGVQLEIEAVLERFPELEGVLHQPALAFRVKDTGIGIPADKQSVIFEAFRQADGGTSRTYGGTGLGLSISREIAWLLGGKIHVSSVPGEGSTFSLILPCDYTSRDYPDRTESAQVFPFANTEVDVEGPTAPKGLVNNLSSSEGVQAPSSTKGTVLVVDDDPRNINALRILLLEQGYQVLCADTGEMALAQLESNPAVGLVFMDIMMPQMDGFETTRLIRSRRQWTNLPVVALTAKAMPGDRERCLEAGASDYVTKPVDLDQLIKCLERWLPRTAPAVSS